MSNAGNQPGPDQAPQRDPATLLRDLLAARPEDRLRTLLDSGGGARLLALGDEAERLATTKVDAAIDSSRIAIELADRIGGPRERSRSRRAHGMALAYGGRLHESLIACEEAAQLASSHGERIESARARMAALHPLCKLGRYEEALRAGDAARAILLDAGEPALAARVDINLANVHKSLGNPARAMEHLARARPAFEDEPAMLGAIDNSRGEALLLGDDFGGAEAAFLAARQRYLASGAGFIVALIEGNLADLLARQGRLQEALVHFEMARRRFEAESVPGHLARLIVEHAEALEALGLPEEAVAGFDDALPRLIAAELAFEVGRGWLGRARALLRLQRYAEAEADLAAAARRFAELGHDVAEARVDVLRGELLIAAGRADEAQPMLARALERLGDRPLAAAVARHHLARLALVGGDRSTAAALLDHAIGTARRLDVPTLLADLLRARGEVRRSAGDLPGAIADLREAVAAVERVRGTLQADRFRAAFLGNRIAVHQDLVRAILDKGGADAIAESFLVAEQAKSRALLDLVRGAVEFAAAGLIGMAGAAPASDAGPTVGDPGGSSAGSVEQRLAAEIARLQSELNALYSRMDGESAADQRRLADESWHGLVRERERRLDRLDARLAMTEVGQRMLATPVDASVVRQALPEDAALIEYFLAGDELVAWVLRNERSTADPGGRGARMVRGLATRSQVTDLVARVQFQLGRSLRQGALDSPRGERLAGDLRATLQALHRAIFAPLVEHLAGVGRLVIVPHGPLHAIPFSALHDGASHLIERFECSAAPSAGVWIHAQRGRSSIADDVASSGPAPSALVVGVSDGFAPRIADEARLVASLLPGAELLLDGAATAGKALAALPRADVVHIACHGRFSALAPLNSGLRLADRWLTVRDLQRLRLRASLVTLSGCDTGRSLIFGGDEMLGLLRGFLAAGASAMVVSLWTVNDTSTAELMELFYANLCGRAETIDGAAARGMHRPGAALRAAQLALLRRRPHPVHWAPFIMVGRS